MECLQLSLSDIILSSQISETLILKFTVITPESLDMSRMIMSVVNVAMGGGQQGSGGGGSASLVSHRLCTDKEVITLLPSFQRTGFCFCFVLKKLRTLDREIGL